MTLLPFAPTGAASGLTWTNITLPPYNASPSNANNLTPINNAISAANSAGGGIIYVPRGTYSYSGGPLIQPAHNVTLLGDGPGDLFSGGLTVLNQQSTNQNGMTLTDGDFGVIQGLSFYGPGSGTGKGIAFNTTTPPGIFNQITNTVVAAFGGDGIYFAQPVLCVLNAVWAANNGGYGFNLDGTGTSVTGISCWARNNAGGGWRVTGNYHSFNGCASDINTGEGWTLNGCQSIGMNGCGSELNTSNAFHLTNSCFGIGMNGCWAFNKAIGLLIDASCFRVDVGGFVEAASAGATFSIQVAAGGIAHIVQPNVQSPTSYLSGGSFVVQILDNGINAGGQVTGSQFVSNLSGGGRTSQGSGAPTNPGGVNPVAGDIYFRTDTPSTANQRIYICTVGGGTPTWVGIV